MTIAQEIIRNLKDFRDQLRRGNAIPVITVHRVGKKIVKRTMKMVRFGKQRLGPLDA
jgi:hypothetical protein